ncbi:MAG: uncharacterized membrane protein YgdD (TMEM256/DUF423 family) [Candidatus Azotimanducaceae bacterium]|jgi:uncharacterized membrane protein YgdD (TMEM256/DUF423 family)
MLKIIFTFASISGLVSVILGAFGAHALRGKLDERSMHAFETGVNYQLSHSIVILFCCLLVQQWGKHWSLEYAAYSFTAGIILFSGSLYLLTITGMKWLGPVTPIGGLCFIVGWSLLSIGIWQNSQ